MTTVQQTSGFLSALGRPAAARRFVTFALCALVVASLALPYVRYAVPVYTAETAAEALAQAQQAYEAEVAAYEQDLRALEEARALIDRIDPLFSAAGAELKALQGAAPPDEEAIAAKQAEYDVYNEQMIEARKITRKASSIVMPVPVQDPAPMAEGLYGGYTKTMDSLSTLPGQIKTAERDLAAAEKALIPGDEASQQARDELAQSLEKLRGQLDNAKAYRAEFEKDLAYHGVSGFSLMTGGFSAAVRTSARWSLIPGVILLLAAAVLSLLRFPGAWRRLLVVLGGILVIFSALRLSTATARELGAVAKVYGFSLGYTVAILGSLLAICSALFEEKTFDLSYKGVKRFASDKAIYLVLLALVVVIAIIRPKFLSVSTLLNILQQSSTRLIIAMGMSFVIIGTGGVDLSCGRVVGMTAVISASMSQTSTYSRLFFPDLPMLPVIVPFVIAVLIALLFGLLNGTVVAKLGVPPFIATLATQVIVYGATSIYFDMAPNNSQPIGGLREEFTNLGSGTVYGFIPIVVITALVVCVTIWFIQNKTVLGKNVFAIGGNREAAKVSGINVTLTIVVIFALASTLIGMAGVLEAARTGGATNNYGLGYELDAIAACVVGGVSSSGGVGTIGGIVSGVLIFQVINYGLTFLGVNPYWQQIIKGIIIASAVALDIRKYLGKK